MTSHCTWTIGVAAIRRNIGDVDRMTRRIKTEQEIKTETENTCRDVQSNKVGYTDRTLTPPKPFHSWTQTCYYYNDARTQKTLM